MKRKDCTGKGPGRGAPTETRLRAKESDSILGRLAIYVTADHHDNSLNLCPLYAICDYGSLLL